MKKYDIHCHVDKLTKAELDSALKENFIICGVAMNLESSKKILELKRKYPNNILAFLGVHPEDASFFCEAHEIIELIEKNIDIIDGIGEVGIPYFYLDDKTSKEKEDILKESLEVLERFVKVAFKYNLPINLHVVYDDIYKAIPILNRHNIKNALFHWYNGDIKNIKVLEENPFFISVVPEILFDKDYLDFVKNIPLHMMLLESDGPWKYNGKRGVPRMIHNTSEFLSHFFNLDQNEFLKKISENTKLYLNR